MATKRPKRKFNLFDEEFGNDETASQPSSPTTNILVDETSKRVRMRQTLVDIPLEGKIEFLRREATSDDEFRVLVSSFLGNPDEILGAKKIMDLAALEPVQDPHKTRVNSVQENRVEPVQDPYKTRVNTEGQNSETRTPTRVSKSEDPYKTRVNPVQNLKSAQTLTGKQKSAFFFLLFDAKDNGNSIENGNRITSQISSSRLAEAALTKGYEATRSVCNALKKAHLISRYSEKSGPGGWTIYEIPKSIYLEGLNVSSRVKHVQDTYKTRVNPVHHPVHQPVYDGPSSSSDLYIKESSTTPLDSTIDAVSNLDIKQLREFGITHDVFKRAMQLHPNAPIEGLQELAFRLGELFKNPKERAKIKNARGFVIKLVEQLASGIVPLDHIETTTDRLVREYADLARQKRAKQQDFEDALLQDAFDKWDLVTVEDEKFQAVPIAKSAPAGQPRKAVLREYFREKVWPEVRERILRGET